MLQKDSERESNMVIGVGQCVQKRSKERETESGEAGKWVTGIQCKLVARDDDGDVRGVTHWGWRTGS